MWFKIRKKIKRQKKPQDSTKEESSKDISLRRSKESGRLYSISSLAGDNQQCIKQSAHQILLEKNDWGSLLVQGGGQQLILMEEKKSSSVHNISIQD